MDYVQPVNAKAWAIGQRTKNGRFHVRRVVWGRLLARAEKRDGETIEAARILVRRKQQPANTKRAMRIEQHTGKKRARQMRQQKHIP